MFSAVCFRMPRPLLLLVLCALPAALSAQAHRYPAFQVPTASHRDFTGGVAAGGGATLIGQWRESIRPGAHWQLEAGIADSRGADPLLFVGGGVGAELLRARADQPLDLLLTAGLGVAVGSGTTWRLPVGVSAGHTIALDEGMAITPFVHPRLSLDGCGRCRRDDDSQLTLSVDVDLGAQWRVREALALTAALAFSGSAVVPNEPMLGVAIRWTPAALR